MEFLVDGIIISLNFFEDSNGFLQMLPLWLLAGKLGKSNGSRRRTVGSG